jgi:hypothetical protein
MFFGQAQKRQKSPVLIGQPFLEKNLGVKINPE